MHFYEEIEPAETDGQATLNSFKYVNLEILASVNNTIFQVVRTKCTQTSIHSYPDNSPGGQFPTVQVLVLMSGFILW